MRTVLFIVVALACLVRVPILIRNYRDWLVREKRNPVSVAIGLEVLLHAFASVVTLQVFARTADGIQVGLMLATFRLLFGANYIWSLRRADENFTSRAGDPLPPLPRTGFFD